MQAGALIQGHAREGEQGGVGLPRSLRLPGERRTGTTVRPVGEEFGLARARGMWGEGDGARVQRMSFSTIQWWTSCAVWMYSREGCLSITCPGRYARETRSRRRFGNAAQCSVHAQDCGGTCLSQPGQWHLHASGWSSIPFNLGPFCRLAIVSELSCPFPAGRMAGTGTSIFGPTAVPPQDGGTAGTVARVRRGAGQGPPGGIRFRASGPLTAWSVSAARMPREAPFAAL